MLQTQAIYSPLFYSLMQTGLQGSHKQYIYHDFVNSNLINGNLGGFNLCATQEKRETFFCPHGKIGGCRLCWLNQEKITSFFLKVVAVSVRILWDFEHVILLVVCF